MVNNEFHMVRTDLWPQKKDYHTPLAFLNLSFFTSSS